MGLRVYKALSVKQPWASRIADGSKRIEYRSWQTHYRGDLLICATARPVIAGLPRGVALCLVDLLDCYENENGWSWRLGNVRLIRPFPVKGRLRLYEVRAAVSLA